MKVTTRTKFLADPAVLTVGAAVGATLPGLPTIFLVADLAVRAPRFRTEVDDGTWSPRARRPEAVFLLNPFG